MMLSNTSYGLCFTVYVVAFAIFTEPKISFFLRMLIHIGGVGYNVRMTYATVTVHLIMMTIDMQCRIIGVWYFYI